MKTEHLRNILLKSFLLLSTFLLAGKAVAEIHRTYHDEITTIADTTIWIPDNGATSGINALEIRASLPKAKDKQGLDSNNSFGIIWHTTNTPTQEFYSATITPGNDAYDHIIDARFMEICVSHHTACSDTIIYSTHLTSGIAPERGENTLTVELDPECGKASIYAGHKELSLIHTLNYNPTGKPEMGICATGTADIALLVSEFTTDRPSGLITDWDINSMNDYFDRTDTDPFEGYWKYLDRETDERYCRPGGLYTIALIHNPTGGYDIIYADGAKVNADKWDPGMLKGQLTPTIFDNHYDLIWFDSSFATVSEECHARIEQSGTILTLSFPLLKSQIRFSRILQSK